MRGDSRQDFYAKALALLGLGVLAGAGALVDYWPTSHPLPVVARALDLPRPLRAALLPGQLRPTSVARFIQATDTIGARQTSLRRAAPTHATLTADMSRVAADETAVATLTSAESTVRASAAESMRAVVASAFTPRADTSPLTSTEITKPTAAPLPVAAYEPDTAQEFEPVFALSSLASNDATAPALTAGSGSVDRETSGEGGLISGAVRKTGASILKGSTKTGTSIVGAIRALGGAMRRAFPG